MGCWSSWDSPIGEPSTIDGSLICQPQSNLHFEWIALADTLRKIVMFTVYRSDVRFQNSCLTHSSPGHSTDSNLSNRLPSTLPATEHLLVSTPNISSDASGRKVSLLSLFV